MESDAWLMCGVGVLSSWGAGLSNLDSKKHFLAAFYPRPAIVDPSETSGGIISLLLTSAITSAHHP